MSIYISPNNTKVKCNLFNLPTGKTCKPGVVCSSYCYAKKAERQYPDVVSCRERNLKATLDSDFPYDMITALERKKNKVVRIHESGDFYSKNYVRKWYRIMRNLPDFKFYAYTKRDDVFDIELLNDKPKNFSLIWSVDHVHADDVKYGGMVDNPGYDGMAVIREHKSTCPAQRSKDKKCITDCKLCLNMNKNKTKIVNFSAH